MLRNRGFSITINDLSKPFSIAILFISFLAFPARADDASLLLKDEFMQDVRHAIHLAYNMEYDASLASMKEWQQEYPEHPLWDFWPILKKWWDVVADLEQEDYDDEFFEFIDQALEASDHYSNLHPDNIDSKIINAAAYGFMTRLHSNRHNWIRSVRYARRAMGYLKEIEEVHPDLPDVEFGNGMYYYFSAFLQDEFPAVRVIGWALPDGDREKGLKLLDFVAEEGVILGPESQYFLGHIYLHYEKSYRDAFPYLEKMAEAFPQNALYTRLLIRTHFRNRNYAEASALLEQALNEQNFVHSSHIEKATQEELHYMSGRIKLHERKYEAAVDDLEKSQYYSDQLTSEQKRHFQVRAGYYLGEAYLRLNDRGKARDQFSKIANSQTDSYVKERAENRLDYLN